MFLTFLDMFLFSTALIKKVNEKGTVGHKRIRTMLLSDIEVNVDCHLHPQLRTSSISGWFATTASTPNRRRSRLASTSSNTSNEETEEDTNEPKHKRSRKATNDSTYEVPKLFEHDLRLHLQEINTSYDKLPSSPDATSLAEGYASMCEGKIFSFVSKSKMFPLSRYSRFYRCRHDMGKDFVCQVGEDRQAVLCTLCDWSFCMGSQKKKWHKPNVVKHFLSKDHWAKLSAKSRQGGHLAGAIEQHKSLAKSELAAAIVDDAVYTMTSKSLPHTAIVASLNCTARALLAVKGEVEMTPNLIYQTRNKVDKQVGTLLMRLQTVTERKKPNRYSKRCVIRRSRTSLAKRIHILAAQKLAKKVEFLLRCNYLSCTVDESDTFSGSAPMAVHIQGCSSDFGWLNCFIGQQCAADDKSGEGCYKLLKKIVITCDDRLWPKIVFTVTDGASAMRSTPKYSGLDGNPQGTSLHAFMRRDAQLQPSLPNLHCLCHILNLALKRTIALSPWCVTWLHHVRCLFNWFSRSPGRKAKLRKLHNEMEHVRDVTSWSLTYPKYYAPTRWIGIRRAVLSILAGRQLLVDYVMSLRDEGYRPDRREYSDQRVQDDADDADGIVDDTDEDDETGGPREEDDENDEDTRYNSHNFYQWGDNSWDLVVHDIDRPHDVMTLDDLQNRDDGLSQVFEEMRDGVKGKRTKLMCEMRGVTRLNFGLDAFIVDVLGPYNTLVSRLQTTSQPIAHLVKEWFLQFFDEMNDLFLGPSPDFGRHYQEWKSRGDDGNDNEKTLRKNIENMGQRFAQTFLKDVKYRVQPYWSLLMACELANPASPKHVSPMAWDGVRDLMKRTGKFTQVEIDATVKNLSDQRKYYSRTSAAAEHRMSENLLKFYHDRFQSSNREHQFALCDEFFRLVSSLHVSSAVIESLFSKTKYIKQKHRSSLSDETVSATMHLRDVPSPPVEVLTDRNPDPFCAIRLSRQTQDDYREKYVGKEIQKSFVDPDGDGVDTKLYRGVITDVVRGESKGVHKWLMHVEYESDSDEEDLEEYEIKRYMISI